MIIGTSLSLVSGAPFSAVSVDDIVGEMIVDVSMSATVLLPIVGTMVADIDIDATDASVAVPTYLGSVSTITTVGSTRTLPDATTVGITLATNDIIWASCVTRQTGTQTISAAAGEGWTLGASVLVPGSNLNYFLFWKRWGAGGQTDDPTPTFTASPSGGTWGVALHFFRGCASTGNPYTEIVTFESASGGGPSTSMVSPLAAAPVSSNKMTMWLATSFDDSTPGPASRGTLAFTSNVGVTGCLAMAYEAGVDSNALSCTITQSTNGPDNYITATIVMTP